MFEILKELRDSWNDSNPIIIFDNYNSTTASYLVLPSQHTYSAQFARLVDFGATVIATIGDELAKFLDLPTLEVLYRGLESRYTIISALLHNGQKHQKFNTLVPPLGHINAQSGVTHEDIALTIRELGEFAAKFESTSPDRYEFIEEFGSNFYIPGHLNVIRGKRGLLKTRVSITELSLALCQISNQAPSTVMVPLINPMTDTFYTEDETKNLALQEGISFVDAKIIINLWRSLRKVNKKSIAAPNQ
ncbi:MAG: 3,4-dihydroxy-2-butanone-4-phosphate synthase [Candidatus Heimdallarchaeota archaeon]|nr:3,4-dihydroxy-2-butanone-4-phosphate synthase [Candidatus Heimdallarchaeota archaeon]